MSKTIKTREVIKDIKTLDKKKALADGTRTAYGKTKEAAEPGTDTHQLQRHGADYAQDKTEQTLKTSAESTGRSVIEGGKKSVNAIRNVRETAKGTKQAAQSASKTNQALSKQAAQKTVSRTVAAKRQASTATGRQAATGSVNAAKGTIKQSAKGLVKTAGKLIKTAEKTAKTTVKPLSR